MSECGIFGVRAIKTTSDVSQQKMGVGEQSPGGSLADNFEEGTSAFSTLGETQLVRRSKAAKIRSRKPGEKKSTIPPHSGVRRQSVSPDKFATAARARVGVRRPLLKCLVWTAPRLNH